MPCSPQSYGNRAFAKGNWAEFDEAIICGLMQQWNPCSTVCRHSGFRSAAVQEAFRQALACPPPDNLSDEQRASAHFGLAATLQFAADCQVSSSRSAADKDVRQMEASARLSAGQLLQEAVVEYKQVSE